MLGPEGRTGPTVNWLAVNNFSLTLVSSVTVFHSHYLLDGEYMLNS